jgi:hypothetical protein
MGIGFSHLPFYDLCYAQKAIQSPLFVLGSQEIHETKDKILDFAAQNGHRHLAREMTARSLFLDRYAVADYRDCDLNGKADLALDFGQPLPKPWIAAARTVLDAGTIEHIFDIGTAFRNLHELTCVGGTIIHVAPISWFEHGYYNFNPMIFRGVAEANGYRLLAEAFHFVRDALDEAGGSRPKMYITFDGLKHEDIREKIFVHLRAQLSVPNVLYMVAHQKINPQDFVCPYDVQA